MAVAVKGKSSVLLMLICGIVFCMIGAPLIYNAQKANSIEYGNVETENSILIEGDIYKVSDNSSGYNIFFYYMFNDERKTGFLICEDPNFDVDDEIIEVYIDSITGELIFAEYSTFTFDGFLNSLIPAAFVMVPWFGIVIFMAITDYKRRTDKDYVPRKELPQFNESYDPVVHPYYANKENIEKKEKEEDPFADYYNK